MQERYEPKYAPDDEVVRQVTSRINVHATDVRCYRCLTRINPLAGFPGNFTLVNGSWVFKGDFPHTCGLHEELLERNKTMSDAAYGDDHADQKAESKIEDGVQTNQDPNSPLGEALETPSRQLESVEEIADPVTISRADFVRLTQKTTQSVISYQGFGMFRIYLGGSLRLHVWDPTQAVPGVSTIHDHPWDFASQVLIGSVTNIKYKLAFDPENKLIKTHDEHSIQCGEGGGEVEEPRPVHLWAIERQNYGPADIYTQLAEDIHETVVMPGTVTLVRRRPVPGRPADIAKVYVPRGLPWVSAEPRPATDEEIRRVLAHVGAQMGPFLRDNLPERKST